VILIACGSRPHRPPQFDFDGGGIYDSTTFMHADCMPRSLAVVGAGPIGCEYACIMAMLDCSVTLIDANDTFLPFLDSEVATLLQQSLMETGIDLMAGTRVDRVSAGPPFTLRSTMGPSSTPTPSWSPQAGSATPTGWRWRTPGSRLTRAVF
jgi:NAD(P) transhydrogenase